MIQPEPIGWVNTGMPVVVLAGLAVGLPRLLVASETRSQVAVSFGIGLTALALLVVGGLLFAAIHVMRGNDVAGAISADTALTLGYLGGLSAKATLIWGPVLALVWFSLAQRVEKHRGEDVARGAGS